MPRARTDPRWELRHDRAVTDDAFRELGVLGGITHVDARSEDGDASSGLQRAVVRSGVDPTREPRHNNESRGGEGRTQALGEPCRADGARPRADDRDAGAHLVESCTTNEQQRRRRVDSGELGRILVVGRNDRSGLHAIQSTKRGLPTLHKLPKDVVDTLSVAERRGEPLGSHAGAR